MSYRVANSCARGEASELLMNLEEFFFSLTTLYPWRQTNINAVHVTHFGSSARGQGSSVDPTWLCLLRERTCFNEYRV